MNILFLVDEQWERAYAQEKLTGHRVQYANSFAEAKELETIEVVSTFVTMPIKQAEIDAMPHLTCIATRSTGFDHVDVAYATSKNIVVCSVPAYGEKTVAEHTFALLLSLSRKIYDSYKQIAETGSFDRTNLRGFDLAGKTIGVIGTGKIGSNVIKIAKGFDMNVIAYDPYPNAQRATDLGFAYTNLETLLSQSDIITLHAPYTPETHHTINHGNIGHIKQGAYILNTARGGLIETDALVQALKSGHVAGAGLDVLEEEGFMMNESDIIGSKMTDQNPLTVLENHYLIDHPRVIITPHNAYNTEEAVHRIMDTTIENIKNYETGSPSNVVKI